MWMLCSFQDLGSVHDQLRDVMFHLDAQQTLSTSQDVTQAEIQEGQIVIQPGLEVRPASPGVKVEASSPGLEGQVASLRVNDEAASPETKAVLSPEGVEVSPGGAGASGGGSSTGKKSKKKAR